MARHSLLVGLVISLASMGLVASGLPAWSAPVTLSQTVGAGGPGDGSEWFISDSVECGGTDVLNMSDAEVDPGSTTSEGNLTDAFDNAYFLMVDGVPYEVPDSGSGGEVDMSTDADGYTTIAGPATMLSGLDVSYEYRFTPSGSEDAIARGLTTLTNSGSSDVSVSVEVGGDLGSDSGTLVFDSSDGDRVATTADRWVVTDGDSSDPVVTHVVAGTGDLASAPSEVSVNTDQCQGDAAGSPDGDDFFFSWPVTVPAGGSRHLMVFVQLTQHSQNTAAEAQANFEDMARDDGLVSDLTVEDLLAIVNWDFNAPPVPTDDQVRTEPSTAVTLSPLSNDTDPEGDTLTVSDVADPTDGTATTDGTEVTYTPDDGSHGIETFTYTVTDEFGESATGTVEVTVNTAPNAADDTASAEDGGRTDLAVLSNDSDPDGDTLSIASFTQPSAGEVVEASSGLTYLAPDDMPEKVTFTYTAQDTFGAQSTATVTVHERAAEAGATLTRVAGDDRVLTSIENSQRGFPDGADTVVIATAFEFADALAVGPLAYQESAPILLSPTDGLTPELKSEIERLGSSTAILAGGESALSSQVAADVRDLGASVDRISGADRFETAAKIGARIGSTHAYVVEGIDGWPDGMSVGPVASIAGDPVLLVTGDSVPGHTEQALSDLGIQDVTIIGGSARITPAVADRLDELVDTVDRISGADRYATSTALANEGVNQGLSRSTTWTATGLKFADALTAGPVVAAEGSSLVLVDGESISNSGATVDWLDMHQDEIGHLVVTGGTAVITDRTASIMLAIID